MRDVRELVPPRVTLHAGFFNPGFFPSLVCTAAQILFSAPQATGAARRRAAQMVCKTRSFETEQNMVFVVLLSFLRHFSSYPFFDLESEPVTIPTEIGTLGLFTALEALPDSG